MKKSWKTTAAGVIAALAVVMQQLAATWDASDLTEPNWGLAGAAIMGAVGLFFARDHDKSSKDVGVG